MSSKISTNFGPDLKKFMDKKLSVKINGHRHVTGILRGYDQFMNITLDECVEHDKNNQNKLGMVLIRGNSIEMLECLQSIKY